MQTALEIIGWIGSILIVVSLTQTRVLRFRWMNLAGSVIATAYNAIIGVWPFVAMNAAIVIINVYWLVRLHREAHDAAVYKVLSTRDDDVFVREFVDVHAADIARYAPQFAATTEPERRRAMFMVVRGDEAVGLVAVRDDGAGVGFIELDWVKERFRDFTPGEFVYRESTALSQAGFTRLELVPTEATDRDYLRKVGFRTDRERWVRDVAA